MTQYISKDAIVAEIKRLMRHSQESKLEFVDIGYNQNAFAEDCRIVSFNKILSFLNTLEVKEVDLENEIDKWYNNEASKEFEDVLYSDIEKFAKHFFELGLLASNKAEKEVEEEPYIMGDIGSYTTTTKAQKENKL